MDEAELARRPDADLLTDPREVREEHGACVEVVEDEVAVGDRVERVPHGLARRRRNRKRRAGERAGAERRGPCLLGCEPEAAPVPVEHFDPREQVMAEGDRLRPLEVGVAGHRGVRLVRRPLEQDARERLDRRDRFRARVLDVEPRRRSHLIVAGAARMDLASHVAETALDRSVDVLVLFGDAALVADPIEPLLDLGELVVGEVAGHVQPAGVQCSGRAVVRQELRVVAAQELSNVLRERRAHPARPERHAGTLVVRTRRAASRSVSSAVTCTKPSAASVGKVSPVP